MVKQMEVALAAANLGLAFEAMRLTTKKQGTLSYVTPEERFCLRLGAAS